MVYKKLKHEIAFEQQNRIAAAAQSAAVTIFAIVTAAIVPQLVYPILLQDPNFTGDAIYLTYLPHVAYGLAALYFLMAWIGNIMRSRKIVQLRKELEMAEYSMDDCGCGGDCQCGHDHHHGHDDMMMEEEIVFESEAGDVSDLAAAMSATPSTSKKAASKRRGRPKSAKKS